MKNKFFIFAAGVVFGGSVASGIFLVADKMSADANGKNTVPFSYKVEAEANSDDPMEFFPPTFTKENCRQWSNYAEYLMRGGYNHTNWDMAMASGLGSFLTEVELYIFMNEKSRTLKGKDRQKFVAQHRQWLKWWNEESKKLVRDPDGNIIEGTMAIPIQAAHPGVLIEEFLKKFPDRAKLEYDYVAEYEKNRKRK